MEGSDDDFQSEYSAPGEASMEVDGQEGEPAGTEVLQAGASSGDDSDGSDGFHSGVEINDGFDSDEN